MDTTPTCPNCGEHKFILQIVQDIEVEFFDPDDHDDGEDHEVIVGPSGDLAWDKDDEAQCSYCGHTAPLKDMK